MNPIELAQRAGAHPWLFLAAALALGALHGLEPGHSKGIMTAFMIGTRGTYAQAVVLALCATLSHTAVVWILAVPASYGGTWWSDAQVGPSLNLISGLVILALAGWMLRRLHAPGHPHDHDHPHGAGDDHDHHPHHHAQDQSHHRPRRRSAVQPRGDALAAVLDDEDDEHARHHMREVAGRFSGRHVSTAQVAVFGLGTGLAPCSAAVVILVTCFRLHQPALGLALVAAFSVGLGATLSAVVLAAAWGVRVAGARSRRFNELARRAPFLSAIVTAVIGICLVAQFFWSR